MVQFISGVGKRWCMIFFYLLSTFKIIPLILYMFNYEFYLNLYYKIKGKSHEIQLKKIFSDKAIFVKEVGRVQEQR